MLSSYKKKFYFIRHGETDFNKEKRYTGLYNISLNKKGIEQVNQSLYLLNEQNISVIYSSPLKRALETATIISKYLNIPIKIVDNFKERDFGIFQAKRKPNYKKKCFYKGQTLYVHQRDTIRGYKKIHDNNFIIVAHSGTFKAIRNRISTKNFKNIGNGDVVSFINKQHNYWQIKHIY